MYAAIHHQGRRLHELARAGQTVERAARPVSISRLDLVAGPAQAPDGTPLLTLDITCSKGTYVRSLARDLGEALGCGAHLAGLTRTWVGPFALDNAITLDTLATAASIDAYLHPPEIAVADIPAVHLRPAESQAVRHGQTIRLPETHSALLRAHDSDGRLLALLRARDGAWKPEKVFPADA
jgi:tRNA pseudouridine55 synthase